jgi:hypothetical protein
MAVSCSRMMRDRLDKLHHALSELINGRDAEMPGWIYSPLTHSLEEIEEMLIAIDSEGLNAAGAEGIAARAEIALEVARAWSKARR